MGEEVTLRSFFEELPSAVVSYSFAVLMVSLAAIALRIAAHVLFGI